MQQQGFFHIILSHYFTILFSPPKKKTPLLIHKQGLERRGVAKAQCFPANITYLLQGSSSSLEGSVYKYPQNCIESSRKVTFLTLPTKLKRLCTFATIHCNHLTGILCFPIYLKTQDIDNSCSSTQYIDCLSSCSSQIFSNQSTKQKYLGTENVLLGTREQY